jgi:three-Cys-motif partner protein
MPVKDHHEKPFSQETIDKLKIFEDYAQAWIPTFVMQGEQEICIFDFFAGPGRDVAGLPGSPIRILMKIKNFTNEIFQKGVKIRIFLNEFDSRKFAMLQDSCAEYLKNNSEVGRAISIEYFNKDFDTVFNELLPIINSHPSLIYLDQNGVKFLSEEYIAKLEKTAKTDFLYFVSSSYLLRFGDQDEFQAHLQLDMEEIRSKPSTDIHRSLLTALRKKLPADTKLKLYPFALKKGRNIYGIVFGASHPRAVEKFLSIAWKQNRTNGEANFDIDNDQASQLDIFGTQKLTKIESFQKLVREKILSGELSNNFELFDFVLEEGHIGTHAAEILKKMKKSGQIDYDNRSPLVTYENVYQKKKKLEYRIVHR